jgi:hypothetical protein
VSEADGGGVKLASVGGAAAAGPASALVLKRCAASVLAWI